MSSKIKKGIFHIILNEVLGGVLWWCLLCFLLWRSFFKSLWIHIFTNVSYGFMTGIHMTPKTYLYSESVPRRWFSHNVHWNMIFPVLSEWMEFPVYQWKTRHDLLQKVHWNTIKKIFFPYKYDNISLSKRKKRWISHFLYYWQNWYFQNI